MKYEYVWFTEKLKQYLLFIFFLVSCLFHMLLIFYHFYTCKIYFSLPSSNKCFGAFTLGPCVAYIHIKTNKVINLRRDEIAY